MHFGSKCHDSVDAICPMGEKCCLDKACEDVTDAFCKSLEEDCAGATLAFIGCGDTEQCCFEPPCSGTCIDTTAQVLVSYLIVCW